MPMRHVVAAASEMKFFYHLPKNAPNEKLRRLVLQNLTPSSWFNPGVLLLDLRRWKSEGWTRAMESLIDATEGWMGDMMLLNVAFCGKFDLLSGTWNHQCLATMFDHSVFEFMMRSAHILHWSCSGHKPWKRGKPAVWSVNDHFFQAYSPRRHCPALDPAPSA
eukprot:UN1524